MTSPPTLAVVLSLASLSCQGRPEPPDAVEPDPIPDASPDHSPDAEPEPEPDAEPDAEPCPIYTAPPGLGGVDDAELTDAAVTRWLTFRAAREEERMLEAARPAVVRARYRIEQGWIDRGCVSLRTVVDLGRGLFLRTFTLEEGLGNDLAGVPGTLAGDRPRPNLRRFQRASPERGSFGGPDATSCVSCHWKGGLAGAGDRADNMFFLGDGDDVVSSDSRNPPALWGAGWTELVAAEMTAELHRLRDEALAEAETTGAPATIGLTASGVFFGQLTAQPGGVLDTSGVEGVDDDLVIKPFGWKGVFPSLRDFILVSAHGHLNLQAEELVAGVEAGSITGVDLGTDDDDDPDQDGVTRELTEGQVTALALFLATLDAPRIAVPPEPELALRWQEGFGLFEDIGCASCHVPLHPVQTTRYATRARLTGSEVSVDLATEGARPHPAPGDDGVVWVPVFSDMKRHRMGAHLAGPNEEHGVVGDTWLTRRLWGLAQTPPYLHDASAASFDEAIAMHGGEGSEAAFAAQAYAALTEEDRASLRVFLLGLRRGPAVRIR